MMPERLKGETLLKVVTIIVIVIGALTIAGGAISYLSSSLTVSMLGLSASAGGVYKLIGAISTVSGIVVIIVGILGYKWRKDIENAVMIIILAIVYIVSHVIFGNISGNLNASIEKQVNDAIIATMPEMQGIMESDLVTSATVMPVDPMTIVCLVLSILMIVGALLNKSTKPIASDPIQM